MIGKKIQALSSRIPPFWAATVSSDLYKPHACLRVQLYAYEILFTNLNR